MKKYILIGTKYVNTSNNYKHSDIHTQFLDAFNRNSINPLLNNSSFD